MPDRCVAVHTWRESVGGVLCDCRVSYGRLSSRCSGVLERCPGRQCCRLQLPASGGACRVADRPQELHDLVTCGNQAAGNGLGPGMRNMLQARKSGDPGTWARVTLSMVAAA
jgi:hypothetical protein